MKVERQDLLSSLKKLKANGYFYLVKITATDYEKYIGVIYMLRNLQSNTDESLEVEIDPSDAWVPSVLEIYRAADWYERELYEMFGIEIRNRSVGRLLLEKWNGKAAPLRKNFAWNAPYETSE